MTAKPIIINNVDMTELFTPTGARVSYAQEEGENSGVMLDGSTTKDVTAIRAVVTLDTMPLKEDQQKTLLQSLFSAAYVKLEFFDPMIAEQRAMIATIDGISTTHRGAATEGVEYWTGMTITFREATP